MAAGDVLVTIKAKVDSVQNAIKAVQQLEEVIVKVSKKKFKIEGLAETAKEIAAVEKGFKNFTGKTAFGFRTLSKDLKDLNKQLAKARRDVVEGDTAAKRQNAFLTLIAGGYKAATIEAEQYAKAAKAAFQVPKLREKVVFKTPEPPKPQRARGFYGPALPPGYGKGSPRTYAKQLKAGEEGFYSYDEWRGREGKERGQAAQREYNQMKAAYNLQERERLAEERKILKEKTVWSQNEKKRYAEEKKNLEEWKKAKKAHNDREADLMEKSKKRAKETYKLWGNLNQNMENLRGLADKGVSTPNQIQNALDQVQAVLPNVIEDSKEWTMLIETQNKLLEAQARMQGKVSEEVKKTTEAERKGKGLTEADFIARRPDIYKAKPFGEKEPAIYRSDYRYPITRPPREELRRDDFIEDARNRGMLGSFGSPEDQERLWLARNEAWETSQNEQQAKWTKARSDWIQKEEALEKLSDSNHERWQKQKDLHLKKEEELIAKSQQKFAEWASAIKEKNIGAKLGSKHPHKIGLEGYDDAMETEKSRMFKFAEEFARFSTLPADKKPGVGEILERIVKEGPGQLARELKVDYDQLGRAANDAADGLDVLAKMTDKQKAAWNKEPHRSATFRDGRFGFWDEQPSRYDESGRSYSLAQRFQRRYGRGYGGIGAGGGGRGGNKHGWGGSLGQPGGNLPGKGWRDFARGSRRNLGSKAGQNYLLGGGFPMLFGGGAGAVGGSLLGSGFAEAIGMPQAGFGLQIAGSAIGTMVDQMIQKVAALGNALSKLDMSALVASGIRVNTEIQLQIDKLKEYGKLKEVQVLLEKEVFEQTGALPGVTQDIANATNLLGATWNDLASSVGLTLGMIGAPFIAALAAIFAIVGKLVQAVNVILGKVAGGIKWLGELLLQLSPNAVNGIERAFAELSGSIAEATNELVDFNKELKNSLEDQAAQLKIEKAMTRGRTFDEKQKNINTKAQGSLDSAQKQYRDNMRRIARNLGIPFEEGDSGDQIATKVSSMVGTGKGNIRPPYDADASEVAVASHNQIQEIDKQISALGTHSRTYKQRRDLKRQRNQLIQRRDSNLTQISSVYGGRMITIDDLLAAREGVLKGGQLYKGKEGSIKDNKQKQLDLLDEEKKLKQLTDTNRIKQSRRGFEMTGDIYRLKQSASGMFGLGNTQEIERMQLDEQRTVLKEKQAEIELRLKAIYGDNTEEIEKQAEWIENNNELKKKELEINWHLTDQQVRINQLYQQIGTTIENGLVNAIESAIEGTKTLGEVAADVFRSIARMLMQYGVSTGLNALMPSFGKTPGPKPEIKVDGKAASGGPVTGGKSYLVGEEGPELFVPGASGGIVANNSLGGGTNIVVNVDASGTSAETDGDQQRQLGNLIGAAVQAEIVRQQRPGGLLQGVR